MGVEQNGPTTSGHEEQITQIENKGVPKHAEGYIDWLREQKSRFEETAMGLRNTGDLAKLSKAYSEGKDKALNTYLSQRRGGILEEEYVELKGYLGRTNSLLSMLDLEVMYDGKADTDFAIAAAGTISWITQSMLARNENGEFREDPNTFWNVVNGLVPQFPPQYRRYYEAYKSGSLAEIVTARTLLGITKESEDTEVSVSKAREDVHHGYDLHIATPQADIFVDVKTTGGPIEVVGFTNRQNTFRDDKPTFVDFRICETPDNLIKFVETTESIGLSVRVPKDLLGEDPDPEDLYLLSYQLDGMITCMLKEHTKENGHVRRK